MDLKWVHGCMCGGSVGLPIMRVTLDILPGWRCGGKHNAYITLSCIIIIIGSMQVPWPSAIIGIVIVKHACGVCMCIGHRIAKH